MTLAKFEAMSSVNMVYIGNHDADYQFDELYTDGGKAFSANKGYKLTKVSYVNEDGEKVELKEGDEIEITTEFIDKNRGAGSDANLYFYTEWEAKDYTAKFYYLNSSYEWVEAKTIECKGGDRFTYNDLLGGDANAELLATVTEACPSEYAVDNTLGITGDYANDRGDTVVYAHMADESEDGILHIYVIYGYGKRYAYADYNNGFDQDGNVNEDRTGENVRYVSYINQFGDVLYDPGFDYDKAVEAAASAADVKKPVFYDIMNSYHPNTTPEKTVTEIDGKDEDGKDIKIEKIVDPKDDKNKPYRNCEFIGWKAYYVDGVYTSFADLPPVSEWHEGYNDRNENGVQHLYTTTILQAQYIADTEFIFRVYDDSNTISWALAKGFKRYYWKPVGSGGDALPGTKAEVVHCQDPENNVNILILPKKDENTGTWYLYHRSIGKDLLNIMTYAKLIPVIIDLLKSGALSELLG